MKNIFLILTLFNIACSPSFNTSKSTKSPEVKYLKYVIEYNKNTKTPFLSISLEFLGNKQGHSFIELPKKWASEKDLYKGIKQIKAVSPNSTIKKTQKPNIVKIQYKPSQVVKVKYEVIQYKEKHRFRPIINNNYIYFIGHGVFAYPEEYETKPINIELVWKNFPDKWKLANSFNVNEYNQKIISTVKEMQSSVHLAGDLVIKKINIKGNYVYLAFLGEWKFSITDFQKLISTIIKTERAFWNDYDFPYFLITMIPGKGYGGTTLNNSIALSVSMNVDTVDRFKHLLTHELFHIWNGGKIRVKTSEEFSYWFTEGFTDYYTRLLNLRAGIITLVDYINDYNNVIYEYYASPVRNKPNKLVLRDFWKDNYNHKIHYLRGDILAHNWNTCIKQESKSRSLDNFMYDLFKKSKNNPIIKYPEAFYDLVESHIGNKGIENIVKYINKGNTIKPHKDALGKCVYLKNTRHHRFDIGFEFDSSEKEKKVIGVKKGSNAYKAGLRNGQKLRDFDIYWGRIDKKAGIRIIDKAGKKKWIRYYPWSRESLFMPQYFLNKEEFNKNPKACFEWFNKN